MPLGGKADGLAWLVRVGESVPPYFLVGEEPGAVPLEDALTAFDARFSPSELVAVRSSALDEDGEQSRAGHYLTRLDVARGDLYGAAAEVLASVGQGSAVVQRMVPTDLSVVMFTANPMGIVNESVVTVAAGAGTAVSDTTPSRTSYVNLTDGQAWSDPQAGAPMLPPGLLERLVATGQRLEALAGHPLDIELAVADDVVWVLQARRITTIPTGPRVTLDSSNIIESYPGLVSPLTASFIPMAYEGVFGGLALRLTRDPRQVAAFQGTLRSLVQASTGRLYYRIDNWYRLMQLMPASGWYIRVWQDSLGVIDRGYDPGAPALGRLGRLQVAVRLLRELHAVPRGLESLHRAVVAERATFATDLAACQTPEELGGVFQRLRTRLFAQWDVTLLNDVRAFVFPALVASWLRLLRRADPVAGAQALISTGVPVESLRPLRELRRLAAEAPVGLVAMTPEAAREFVAGPGAYPARLRAYLEQYGDRCFEELKLESTTLRQDPAQLVRLVAAGGSLGAAVDSVPDGPSRDMVLRVLVANAREAIVGRESSRLDRARVYGMARDLVRRAGDLGVRDGRLDRPDDVFWLTIDDAFRSQGDVRGLVARRRSDQESYARLPHYRRLVFAGQPFDRRPSSAVTISAADEAASGLLTGVAVSAGVVTGPVRIVTDASAVRPQPGDILVTAMTDPGWVFLLAGAGGVVAERGSPLSHTAIVARELGVPMVVGVDRATRRFHDGDVVEVDGTAGTVRVLSNAGAR